jgi:DNA repair protein RadC
VRLQPRDVLVPALCANAAGLIVCHNHPSVDATPSRADRVVTAALRNAAQIVGLPLLDHIIVTDTEHFSFRSMRGGSEAPSCSSRPRAPTLAGNAPTAAAT